MLDEQVAIRRAKTSDLDALRAIKNESVAALSLDTDVDLRPRLEADGVFTYLAEDSEPFGFITVGQSEESLFDPASTGEVLEWYLAGRRSQKGYGSKLLVRGLSVLKRRFFDQAVIWLPADAVRAISILNSLGFENAGMERIANSKSGSSVSNADLKDLGDYF